MMTDDAKLEDWKEFKLEYGFSLRQGGEHNAIFKDGKPIEILEIDSNIYNKLLDFKPRAKSISIKGDRVSIDFIVESKKYETPDLSGFYINIGNKCYDFKKDSNSCHVDIPFDSIDIAGSTSGIFLFFQDENGFSYKRKLLSMTGPHSRKRDHRLYYSRVKNYRGNAIFVYETWAGYLTLAFRGMNKTDSPREQNRINLAFLKHKRDVKLKRDVPSILLFEKFCGKYEESAKYVYEKLIDDGCENVYFILDKDSADYKEIDGKYRKNIIEKHSFEHYYQYFNAKAFISTESMNHAVELTTSNQFIRRRQMWDDYHYFFLQHGVMYAYSIKGRGDFTKGNGFRDNSFVVVSSLKEAEHFMEDGKFDREDLIISGLPKLDHATQNRDADKIMIMPTSRNFESALIRDNPEDSTYYNFSKGIIESVPEELREKIIYLPHPLVYESLKKTDLKEYMVEESNYDKLLKDTRLLITDYSSISYDAFYRGSNVLFAWMEKESCLEKLGLDLKLNDDNAFGDIAYDFESLEELILKNYNGSQSEENIERYRQIVEFNDNHNTERFLDYLYSTSLFPEKSGKFKIDDCLVSGVEDRAFTGKAITVPNIKVSLNGKKLIRNIDFKVKLHDNVEIGTAQLEIVGKGIYSGSKFIDFKIRKSIAKSKCEFSEDGLAVSLDGEELTEDKDYTCKEEYYPKIGMKKIIISGINEYIAERYILLDILK